jgi:hypothetical protein
MDRSKGPEIGPFLFGAPEECLLSLVGAPFRGAMRTSDRLVRNQELDLMSETGGQVQNGLASLPGGTADTRIFRNLNG